MDNRQNNVDQLREEFKAAVLELTPDERKELLKMIRQRKQLAQYGHISFRLRGRPFFLRGRSGRSACLLVMAFDLRNPHIANVGDYPQAVLLCACIGVGLFCAY